MWGLSLYSNPGYGPVCNSLSGFPFIYPININEQICVLKLIEKKLTNKQDEHKEGSQLQWTGLWETL